MTLDIETHTRGECLVKMKTEVRAVQIQARNASGRSKLKLGEGRGAGSPCSTQKGPARQPQASILHLKRLV